MKDISLHLLDILENSAKAGASLVMADFSIAGQTLTLEIQDNGSRFPVEDRAHSRYCPSIFPHQYLSWDSLTY